MVYNVYGVSLNFTVSCPLIGLDAEPETVTKYWKLWQPANDVITENGLCSRGVYRFDERTGQLDIREPGLYHVYAQVSFQSAQQETQLML